MSGVVGGQSFAAAKKKSSRETLLTLTEGGMLSACVYSTSLLTGQKKKKTYWNLLALADCSKPLTYLMFLTPKSDMTRKLRELLQKSDNRVCADCGAPDPKWA